MNLIKIILFLTFSTSLYATTLEMSEFSSTFYNIQNLNLKRINIDVIYHCEYGYLTSDASCGKIVSRGVVKPTSLDASEAIVTFPEKRLRAKGVPFYLKSTIHFYAEVKLYLDGNYISGTSFIKGSLYQGRTHSVQSYEAKTNFINIYKKLAFISIPSKKAKFVLENGQDAVSEIVKRFGKESNLRFYMELNNSSNNRSLGHLVSTPIALAPHDLWEDVYNWHYPAINHLFVGFNPNSGIELSTQMRVEPGDRGSSWKPLEEESSIIDLKNLPNEIDLFTEKITVDSKWRRN